MVERTIVGSADLPVGCRVGLPAHIRAGGLDDTNSYQRKSFYRTSKLRSPLDAFLGRRP